VKEISNLAFVQNATIRENFCFGRPFEEGRYWKAVTDSCLQPDLEMLRNGDMTEVGEKGVSLSGGQKQRLNICRAIYCDTEIQIFDVSIFLISRKMYLPFLRKPGLTKSSRIHSLHWMRM